MVVTAQKIPTEILFNIFQRLPIKTMLETCVVCKSWKRAATYALLKDVTLPADRESIKEFIIAVQTQVANENINFGAATRTLTLNVAKSDPDTDMESLANEIPNVKSIKLIETKEGAMYDNEFLIKSMEHWSNNGWKNVEKLNMRFHKNSKVTRERIFEGNESLYKIPYSFRNTLTHLALDSSRSPVMPHSSLKDRTSKATELLSHFPKLTSLKVINHKILRDSTSGDKHISLAAILRDCPSLVKFSFFSTYPTSNQAIEQLCLIKEAHTKNGATSTPLISPELKDLKIVMPKYINPYVDYLMSHHSGNYDSFSLTLLQQNKTSTDDMLNDIIRDDFANYLKTVKDLDLSILMSNASTQILHRYDSSTMSIESVTVHDTSLYLPKVSSLHTIWRFIRTINANRGLHKNYKLTFNLTDDLNHFLFYQSTISAHVHTKNYKNQPTLFSLKIANNQHLFLNHLSSLTIPSWQVQGETLQDYTDQAKSSILPHIIGAFDHQNLSETIIDSFDVSFYLNTDAKLTFATLSEFLDFIVRQAQPQRIGFINLETYGMHDSVLTSHPTFHLRSEPNIVVDKISVDKLTIMAMPSLTSLLIHRAVTTLEFKHGILHVERYPPTNYLYMLDEEVTNTALLFDKVLDLTLDLTCFSTKEPLEELHVDIDYKNLCKLLETKDKQDDERDSVCHTVVFSFERADKKDDCIRYVYQRGASDSDMEDGNNEDDLINSGFVLSKKEWTQSFEKGKGNTYCDDKETVEIKIICNEFFVKKFIVNFFNRAQVDAVSQRQAVFRKPGNNSRRTMAMNKSRVIPCVMMPFQDWQDKGTIRRLSACIIEHDF